MLSQDSVQLRQWLEMVPDAFILSDADGQILFANSQTERLFGYERDELSGQNLTVLIPDRYHHRHGEYLRAYHSKPEVRMMGTGRELIGRRKDGDEVAVDIALSPIRVEDSDCVLAAIRDMTLWKQAEAQIRDHAQRLEDSNQNLKAFACVASHDLQAPLRQIRTLCELLEDHGRDNLDEHAQTLVGQISGCANRLSALVNSLLAHSRIDATQPTLEPVDCSELLACILQDFETPIQENHAVVTHDVLPTIQADRIQLRQLLQNLVGNALKYCDDRTPVVHVGVESRSCEWLFSVRDNGIGIEARHFDQIFVMFARLHGDESYPGTGVGLATCKRIVERHGGRIWVESQPNEGSVFCFTIPRL